MFEAVFPSIDSVLELGRQEIKVNTPVTLSKSVGRLSIGLLTKKLQPSKDTRKQPRNGSFGLNTSQLNHLSFNLDTMGKISLHSIFRYCNKLSKNVEFVP